MIVKDEERHIADCLAPILDLVDDVVIVDMGSTDRTCEILRERFGIVPLTAALDHDDCNSKSPARNLGFECCCSPWIMRLDADERIAPADFERLLAFSPDGDTAGYFVEWATHRGGQVTVDYKLLVFRNGIRATGCAHENMQVDIRDQGFTAAWFADITLQHNPDAGKDPWKKDFYRERLTCAVTRYPRWYRYHWFLGYASFNQGNDEEARFYLQLAVDARSRRFPVECLNAHMVLAVIHARGGERDALIDLLEHMRSFHAEVADDFEVVINHHLGPWIEAARTYAAADRLEAIAPREFST